MAQEGDRLSITGIIANASPTTVRVFVRAKAWAVSNFAFYDARGQRLRDVLKGFVSPLPPDASNFVMLQPGDAATLPFAATVRRTTVFEGGDSVTGLFLDFGESAVLLPGPGSYDIELVLDHERDVIQGLSAEFGFVNVWHGSEVSPRLTFIAE